QTRCLTAVQIPGNPLRSFDISFVNPDRGEYYLAERSNGAVVVINTKDLDAPVRMLGGFVGIKNNPNGTVNNNISGPDGVAAHGRWLDGGDGDNPAGCNYGQLAGPVTCSGGLFVIDPHNLPAPTLVDGVMTSVIGAFDPATNTGVLPLNNCGPNGATVGPNSDLMLGCTPQNEPTNTTTLVINAKTKNTATVNGITGSDEVWFNKGDNRYYLGASRACG